MNIERIRNEKSIVTNRLNFSANTSRTQRSNVGGTRNAVNASNASFSPIIRQSSSMSSVPDTKTQDHRISSTRGNTSPGDRVPDSRKVSDSRTMTQDNTTFRSHPISTESHRMIFPKDNVPSSDETTRIRTGHGYRQDDVMHHDVPHGNYTSPTTYRAPNPALNVKRRNEPVATDTVFSDTPAIGCGSTHAQIFMGTKTKSIFAHGCKSDAEFVRTLQDEIRKRGAMDVLISDNAKAEVSAKIQDILQMYAIDDWQSEPHCQHQNPCERRWGTAKANFAKLMNISGAPPEYWLLALQHVCMIMNCTATKSIGYRMPYEKLYGVTPDISALTEFHFNEPVYYKTNHDKWENFPSKSNEALGYWVGVSESVGDAGPDSTYIDWAWSLGDRTYQ